MPLNRSKYIKKRIIGFEASFEHSYISPMYKSTNLQTKPENIISHFDQEYLSDDASMASSVSSSDSEVIFIKRKHSDPIAVNSYIKASRGELKAVEDQINMENYQKESRKRTIIRK
ncbi:hypothetical protein HDV04_001925 [Boothiomyces sp. JEL0838]|nr:hypothetical protein HDV04_001900 [Boothiomyces sp. JEL0838]KAJ3313496.1 hypothetical protein HDV04_001925 [Boothiomyces sp. JEL0838]